MKTIINKSDSVESAVRKYCEERGFGSMNKNDFEVSIFSLLLTMLPYKGKSNYELSLLLRIPESKIKRLRYESALKAPTKSEKENKQAVKDLLTNASLRSKEKKVVFQVEDIMLKMYITSILKKEGRTIDTSFNPELVVIHAEDFQFLVKAVCSKQEIDKLMTEAKKAIKNEAQNDVTWSDIMGWVIQGAVSGIASGVVSAGIDLSPVGIIKIIKNVVK